uniref:hypothetical protein n=1 Tax=Caballeronia arationis TaxID=1777142 RepID=UPI001F248027|nr:hypothetical protein [Caballeronia arationis]
MRFGIDTLSDYTLEELGKQFDVTRSDSPDREQDNAKTDAHEPRRQATRVPRPLSYACASARRVERCATRFLD